MPGVRRGSCSVWQNPISELIRLSPAHFSLSRLHFSLISCTVGSLDDFKGVNDGGAPWRVNHF